MASTLRNGLPEFWTTALAKALSGDQPCHLAPWLAAHYRLEKRERDDESQAKLAKWKADHSAMLTSQVEKMRSEGWKVDVERYFKTHGQKANVAGKADIVAQKADVRPLIVDVKSGSPRDSDVLQVIVEMILIPMAWEKRMIFSGLVVYPTHEVNIKASEAEELKPRLFALIKKLSITTRPDPSPGKLQCKFCDVSEFDCPDRWKETDETQALEPVTDLF